MDRIIKQVNEYYTSKITKFGATPQGVDWNSIASQELRFEILATLINEDSNFSLLDYGCGFGSMYNYFKSKYQNFSYIGYDISREMISVALEKFSSNDNLKWYTALPDLKSDYLIASGIFNVKLENNDDDWLDYVLQTIHKLDEYSEKGFAFNVLTKYSDVEHMKGYLYYADPLFLFDYCKKNFSKKVALLHDYDLYEFSILVRK